MAGIWIDDEAEELWREIVESEEKVEKGITHKMTNAQVMRIVSSIPPEAETFIKQVKYDLAIPRFKLWDEIGMLLTGRCKGYPEGDEKPCEWSKLVARAYIECVGRTDIPEELYTCVIDEEMPKAVGEMLVHG